MDDEDELEVVQRFGLPPRPEDLPAIRAQLAEATRLDRDTDDGNTPIMKVLSLLLFAAGDRQDSLLIWRAKRASFDAGCSIDVQLLCGAGFDATLRFLRETDSEESRAALAYILECDAAGDFEGHDAPGGRLSKVLPSYRDYYGIP